MISPPPFARGGDSGVKCTICAGMLIHILLPFVAECVSAMYDSSSEFGISPPLTKGGEIGGGRSRRWQLLMAMVTQATTHETTLPGEM